MRRMFRRGPLLILTTAILSLLWIASFLVSARVCHQTSTPYRAGRWAVNSGAFLQHGWLEVYRQAQFTIDTTAPASEWEFTTVPRDFSIAGRWRLFRYAPPAVTLGGYSLDVAGLTLHVERRALLSGGNTLPGEITVFLPVLWPLLLCAALAALILYKPVQRKRLKHGLCVSCGYDVRITPGRCPECGRPDPLVPATTT